MLTTNQKSPFAAYNKMLRGRIISEKNTVGQGPIALAVGAGGGGLGIFTLICPFSSVSLALGDGPI